MLNIIKSIKLYLIPYQGTYLNRFQMHCILESSSSMMTSPHVPYDHSTSTNIYTFIRGNFRSTDISVDHSSMVMNLMLVLIGNYK